MCNIIKVALCKSIGKETEVDVKKSFRSIKYLQTVLSLQQQNKVLSTRKNSNLVLKSNLSKLKLYIDKKNRDLNIIF